MNRNKQTPYLTENSEVFACTFSTMDKTSDDSWNDLSKSDYAKVIFSDLYHRPHMGVGCKFQITDNVSQDPCDYIGLFRVGHDSLSQCLVSRTLSETHCEENEKLLSFSLKTKELPELDDGFYQFLYVTRDEEICGASMPFQIKSHSTSYSSDDDVVADKVEDDFLVVRSNMAEENQKLKFEVEKLQKSNENNQKEAQSLETSLLSMTEEKKQMSQQIEALSMERNKLINQCENVMKELESLKLELESEKDSRTYLNLVLQNVKEEKRRLENDLTNMTKELESLKLELASEKDNRTYLKLVLQNVKEEKMRLENDLTEFRKKFLENVPLLEEKEFAENQLKVSSEMIKALEDSKLLALEEITKLTAASTQLNIKNSKLVKENESLKSQMKDAEFIIKELKEQLKKLEDESCSLNLKLEEAVSSTQLQVQATSLETEKSTLNTKIFELEEKHKMLQVQATSLETEKSTLNTEILEMEEKYKMLEADRNSFRCESYANKLKLRDTLAVVDKYKKKVSDLKSEIAALKLYMEECQISPKQMQDRCSSAMSKFHKIKKRNHKKNNHDHHSSKTDVLPTAPSAEASTSLCSPNETPAISSGGLFTPRVNFEQYQNASSEEPIAVAGPSSEGQIVQNQAENDSNSETEHTPDVNYNDLNIGDSKAIIFNKVIDEIKTNIGSVLETINMETLSTDPEFVARLELNEALEENKTLRTELAKLNTEAIAKGSVLNKALEENKTLRTELEKLNTEAIAKGSVLIKLMDENKDLKSKAFQTDEEMLDLKRYCGELRNDLAVKEAHVSELNEDSVKKAALVEYLTKETNDVKKLNMELQEALKDATRRLNDAADIYRKQYVEIERLKKKLKKMKQNEGKESAASASVVSDVVSESDVSETRGNEEHIVIPFERQVTCEKAACARQKSDSDTGEPVVMSLSTRNLSMHSSGVSSCQSTPCVQASSSTDHLGSHTKEEATFAEPPGLQSLIEQNLAILSASKTDSKTDEIIGVPCPICNQDVGVTSRMEEMVNHLEMQHKQQMCPICSMLFDMTLPKNYFVFHIEDHFAKKH